MVKSKWDSRSIALASLAMVVKKQSPIFNRTVVIQLIMINQTGIINLAVTWHEPTENQYLVC
jgi:hypothetical protein